MVRSFCNLRMKPFILSLSMTPMSRKAVPSLTPFSATNPGPLPLSIRPFFWLMTLRIFHPHALTRDKAAITYVNVKIETKIQQRPHLNRQGRGLYRCLTFAKNLTLVPNKLILLMLMSSKILSRAYSVHWILRHDMSQTNRQKRPMGH